MSESVDRFRNRPAIGNVERTEKGRGRPYPYDQRGGPVKGNPHGFRDPKRPPGHEMAFGGKRGEAAGRAVKGMLKKAANAQGPKTDRPVGKGPPPGRPKGPPPGVPKGPPTTTGPRIPVGSPPQGPASPIVKGAQQGGPSPSSTRSTAPVRGVAFSSTGIPSAPPASNVAKPLIAWNPGQATAALPRSVQALRQQLAPLVFQANALTQGTESPKGILSLLAKGMVLGGKIQLGLPPNLRQGPPQNLLANLRSFSALGKQQAFVNLSALPNSGATPKTAAELRVLDRWINSETKTVLQELRERYEGQKTPEFLAAPHLARIFAQMGWLGIALYMVLNDEQIPDEEVAFDAEQLEQIILAEIRGYFDAQDFSQVKPPKAILLLEQVVLCEFPLPAAVAGSALSFQDVEGRGFGKDAKALRLRQKSQDTPLEEPLRQVEASINRQVEACAATLAKQHVDQSVQEVYPGLSGYSWHEVAIYLVVRGKNPLYDSV